MKKIIFIFLSCTLPSSIFALDFPLGVGAGSLLGYTFTRYTIEGSQYGFPNTTIRSTQDMDRFDYGGFLFFDAKYAVFSVILQGGKNSYKEQIFQDRVVLSQFDGAGTGSEMSLGFSLLGKYPITINERIIWFPMFGVEYHIALLQRRQPDGDRVHDRTKGTLIEDLDKNQNPYPLSAWNSWWINVGAGFDYELTELLFLRGELLFGFRLPTKYEMGSLKMIKDTNGPVMIRNEKVFGLTGGPSLKFGVGYRL